MKSIKFLLLFITLIANTAQPMSTITNALKRYAPGVTGVAISNLPWIGGHALCYFAAKDTQERSACLNEEPQTKLIVKDLLDTYANGEDVKIYSPHRIPGRTTRPEEYDAITFRPSGIISLERIHRDALEDINHPMHYSSRATVGHELGHVKNNHFFHTLDIAKQIGTSLGLYNFLRSGLFKRSHWVLKPILSTAAISSKLATDYCTNLASGKLNEYLADQNLIQHAKDPRDLRELASFFKEIGNKYAYSFLYPHQHPLIRAQAFENAADKLEKRLAQQKSL